jgi:hypothetical protein
MIEVQQGVNKPQARYKEGSVKPWHTRVGFWDVYGATEHVPPLGDQFNMDEAREQMNQAYCNAIRLAVYWPISWLLAVPMQIRGFFLWLRRPVRARD